MNAIKIDINAPDAAVLGEAARLLDEGRAIAFPTETFYGLLARIDRPEGLKRVLSLKGRGETKPMPCLASDPVMAAASFDPPPAHLPELAARFWPGPLTIVGRSHAGLIGYATGIGRTIGVRVPSSAACRLLVEKCGCLVAATSANPSESPPAASAAEVTEFFAGEEELVVFDGGILPPSLGSTIIDLSADPPCVIREGDAPLEPIEKILGRGLVRVVVRGDEKLQELMQGPLRILQKTAGFRYSIDALILASFVEFKPGDRVVDIGSGTGVIPLILAGRGATRVVGVELQTELVDMSQRSIAANGLQDRAGVIHGDARDIQKLFGPGSFDIVVSNPPYFPVGTGHLSPDDGRAASRHELTLSLSDLVKAANYLLRDGGRVFIIHLAARERELLDQMKKEDLAPGVIQRVLPKADGEPKFILVRGTKGGGDALQVIPPLVLHEEDGCTQKR